MRIVKAERAFVSTIVSFFNYCPTKTKHAKVLHDESSLKHRESACSMFRLVTYLYANDQLRRTMFISFAIGARILVPCASAKKRGG